MAAVETKPIQLEFGQKIPTANIAERTPKTGIIKENGFVVVPKVHGGYCNAKLTQDVEVVKTDGRIRGLSAFRLIESARVGKNFDGDWSYWTIPQGSVIGAYSKQVRKNRKK